jgi:hypothetical protein
MRGMTVLHDGCINRKVEGEDTHTFPLNKTLKED